MQGHACHTIGSYTCILHACGCENGRVSTNCTKIKSEPHRLHKVVGARTNTVRTHAWRNHAMHDRDVVRYINELSAIIDYRPAEVYNLWCNLDKRLIVLAVWCSKVGCLCMQLSGMPLMLCL